MDRALEKHNVFKNESNPFPVLMEETLRRRPVKMPPMRDWLRRQE